MSITNYISWHPSGRIFICLICHVGVCGPAVKQHFERFHIQTVPKQIRGEIKHFIANYKNLYHIKQSEVVALVNHIPPIPELAPPKIIFQCRVCQVFLTKSDQTVRKHSKICLETHPHILLDPRDLSDPASPSSFRYQTCLAQTWDEDQSAINRWWIVQGTPATDPAPSSSIPSSSLDEQDRRELAEAAAQELEEYRPAIYRAPFSVDQDNAWIKRTGWEKLFNGLPHILIGHTTILPHRLLPRVRAWTSQTNEYLFRSPAQDEIRLHHVMLAIDRLFLRLLYTFDNTELLHKVWLNSFKYATSKACYAHPVRRLERRETQRAYLNRFKRLICYVMRIFRFPNSQRDKVYRFSFTQKENNALSAIWRHLEQTFPDPKLTGDNGPGEESDMGGEDPPLDGHAQEDLLEEDYLEEDEMEDEMEDEADDEADDEETVDAEVLTPEKDSSIPDLHPADSSVPIQPATDSDTRLVELVFWLAMSLWTSPFRSGNPYDGAVGHFLAAAGIDTARHGFHTVHSYPPFLSGLGWIAQLLFLEYALPYSTYPDLGDLCLPRHRYRHPTNRIRAVRSTFMVVGRNYPLSEVWALRNFGRAISREEPPPAQLKWSFDGQEVTMNDQTITMSVFRGWVQSHVRRTYDNLQSLLRGFAPASMDFTQPFDLADVRDRHVNSDHQYNFRSEPRNGLKDRWIEFSHHLRGITNDHPNSLYQRDPANLNPDAVHAYLGQHLSFLKWDLLPACHTTGGSPARGPEISSVKLFNPSQDIFRNVFLYNGYFCFLTEYHKARASTNRAFYVARFFPSVVGRLLYTYIVYVRPCVERLAAKVHQTRDTARTGVLAKKTTSPYLFADARKEESFWRTTILTKALKASSQGLDVSFTVHNYRHIAIGTIRKHVPLVADPLHTQRDGTFDFFEQAPIFQSAHGPRTDGHYAMDQEFQTKCQPHVLSAYFAASQRWWRWLQIDEGDWVITKDLGLGALASAAPTATPEALEVLGTPLGSFASPPNPIPNPTPPSSPPSVSFGDGEGGGFLFDRYNGQDTREVEDTIILDMSVFPHREPVERAWPVRPVTVEVIIPSKRATIPPSSPIVPFNDSEGRGFPFDQNEGQDTSDQEPSEDESTIAVDTPPLRRRELDEPAWPVRPMIIEVVIPSKRASRKRQASVSPERPSRACRGQPRRSLRGRSISISTEATLSSDEEPLPAQRRRRGPPSRFERQQTRR
jgi:hypothetical protein